MSSIAVCPWHSISMTIPGFRATSYLRRFLEDHLEVFVKWHSVNQYNALFSVQPQFDLVNMSSIAQIKICKNQQRDFTASQNLLNELQIYENLNVTYHNILSLKGQKDILIKNIAIAEQIKTSLPTDIRKELPENKRASMKQKVNMINLLDKMEQLEYNIRIQEKILALFFENNTFPEIEVKILMSYALEIFLLSVPAMQNLNVALQSQMLRQDIKTLQYQYYPILSFTSSFNWQNTNVTFLCHQLIGDQLQFYRTEADGTFLQSPAFPILKTNNIRLKRLS